MKIPWKAPMMYISTVEVLFLGLVLQEMHLNLMCLNQVNFVLGIILQKKFGLQSLIHPFITGNI